MLTPVEVSYLLFFIMVVLTIAASVPPTKKG